MARSFEVATRLDTLHAAVEKIAAIIAAAGATDTAAPN
jgi:hypothetical protein